MRSKHVTCDYDVRLVHVGNIYSFRWCVNRRLDNGKGIIGEDCKRMEVMGIQFAPLHVPAERRMQTFSVFLVTGLFLISGPTIFSLLTYMLFFTKYYWVVLAYFAFVFGESNIAERGGRSWNWVRRFNLWKHLRNYFPLHLVKTVDLDPANNYLLCVFPHGLVSAGVVVSFGTDAGGFSRLFPGIKPHVATLALNFKIPLLRDLFLALGFCSVSKESLNFLLGSPGTGRATVVVIGGAAESLKSKPGTYRLTLKNRKGFVKLALKNGASLVPVFSFGENDLFDQWANPEGSLLRSAQDLFMKFTGVAPIVPLGRGVFQYSFGTLPRRNPVFTVVGKPIAVKKNPNPSDDQIDELHKRFIDSLTSLFESEKHKYEKNADEVTLVIE